MGVFFRWGSLDVSRRMGGLAVERLSHEEPRSFGVGATRNGTCVFVLRAFLGTLIAINWTLNIRVSGFVYSFCICQGRAESPTVAFSPPIPDPLIRMVVESKMRTTNCTP